MTKKNTFLGQIKKVEPIKNYEDIIAIKKLLKDQPRNFTLFTLGINTNLRASDILNLKVHQIQNIKPNHSIDIKEKKTGKKKGIMLNTSCIQAIQNLLNKVSYNPSEYLFKTRQSEVLTVSAFNRLVKKWCRDINLRGNYGTHTLRKTWGYHQRVRFKVDIPTLMVYFNHTSQKQTLDYLCIQPEEIKQVYKHEL